MKYVNIVECSVENVKLDMQKLANPNIKHWEYQHRTLKGITIKEYLHNKYGYTCQYCGDKSGDKKLEVEHIICKTNGGHSRIDNLTLACHTCNQDKGNYNLKDWLDILKKSKKSLDKERVKKIEDFLSGHILKPKNYGAWINSYNDKLIDDINNLGFQNVELSDGITINHNRIQHVLEKEHYNDAICIGNIPQDFNDYTTVAYIITAKGRGNRIKGKPNSCGILSKNNINRHKTFENKETGEKF